MLVLVGLRLENLFVVDSLQSGVLEGEQPSIGKTHEEVTVVKRAEANTSNILCLKKTQNFDFLNGLCFKTENANDVLVWAFVLDFAD